jgi:hypothetical protein
VKDTLRALFGKELAYVAKIDPAFVGGTRSRREYINVKEDSQQRRTVGESVRSCLENRELNFYFSSSDSMKEPGLDSPSKDDTSLSLQQRIKNEHHIAIFLSCPPSLLSISVASICFLS